MAASPGRVGLVGPVRQVGRTSLRFSYLPYRADLPYTAPVLDFHRLADDPLERPPLAAALRTGLDDLDDVPRLRFVLLVVHHELRRAALGLAVKAVAHLPLDRDHDALLHLVADDDAGLLRFRRHNYPRFCLSTVLIRARSRRTVRIFS